MVLMKGEILEVRKIVRKAKLFSEIMVGDRLQLEIGVSGSGRSSRGIYANYITVSNLKTGDKVLKSFNQIGSILDCFEFVEVKEP